MTISKRKSIAVAAILLLAGLMMSFLSPEWTVRRYIFLHGQLVTSVTTAVHKTGYTDVSYGELYVADGYIDRATGDEVDTFYLKRLGPFWYVSTAGSGP